MRKVGGFDKRKMCMAADICAADRLDGGKSRRRRARRVHHKPNLP